MNLEKEFVSYEQSVALRELEFDEPCLAYYHNLGSEQIMLANGKDYMAETQIGSWEPMHAPLKQQVFRWLRDKYDLHHAIYRTGDDYGHIVYRLLINNTETVFTYHYLTYEEAESECATLLIELAKEQKKIDLIAEVSGW